MSHPPLATHMVSLPDGKLGNNALGYCTSTSRNPGVVTSLVPLGPAWSRRVWQGTAVIVKWLQLPGQPEFVHVLDGETSTTTKLPRRLRQRSLDDVVTIRTLRTFHLPEPLLQYGKASAFIGDVTTVTPLGKWERGLPAGSGVEILNLSAPGNAIKSGLFGSQAAIVKGTGASVKFIKDSPGA